MAKFNTRNQVLKASDEEIEKFFEETTFEGIFSFEVKSKNSDLYKGSISDIKLEGRPTNLIGHFLNVPKNSVEIPEGPCSFRCRMNITALRENELYKVNLRGATLRAIDKLTESNVTISSLESKEQDLYDMWGVDNCQCIGYYHYDEDSEVYVVDDLRKPNFDHIPYYPGDTEKRPIRITYPHEIRGIKLNDYYLFTWKLSHKNRFNPYEIYLDFNTQPKPIDPKWFINTLFDDRHNDKSKNFGSAANFLDTLSKQLSAKESTFVYELLQNANDYPVEGCSVDVEFHITDNYLLFLHTGDKFSIRNISGICGINEKEKVANKKTIGYKGIGFKTVFLNNHYVYLRTGAYSFRFDEGETPEKKVGGKIKRLGAPFQILPIWTKHAEVDKEVNEVFDHSGNNFRVQIALRPDNKDLLHTGKNSYENLFREVFSDSNIILFIPNINSVKVFIDGEQVRNCERNTAEWIVSDYQQDIDPDLQALINKTIDTGRSRIPEKYKDFDATKVSFACNHEGAIIKPIDNSILYCYLPTTTSWGFPFLLNTDMIPKGDRNNIETEVVLLDEETNFNGELTAIAGTQLFHWLFDLLTSRKYDLGSVFSLVPDFEKCIREHKEYKYYIEKFQKSFEAILNEENLIPVSRAIANINYIVRDTTGITSSGIMTDDEFFTFIGIDNAYLPRLILRTNKPFNKFLKHYANEKLTITEEDLHDMVSNENFQEWLKIQDNNNKFLNFLLENDYLDDFFDEKIFIEEECGNLYSASELYYDVDDELKDLSAFSNHIYYLSLKTREFFKDNEKWNESIQNKFAEFDGDKFIKETLLEENWNETVKALGDWETSLHFYSYLSKNDIVPDELCDLPFFNDEEAAEIVDDFNDKFVFFSSLSGKKVCNAQWLSSIDFAFISPKYDERTLEYLKGNAGVREFSNEIIVEEIILNKDDYQDNVNNSQQEDVETSLDFVKYCFEHKDLFEKGSLRNYALNAYDCDGDEEFVLSEDHIYFPSADFDEYSKTQWLSCDWMYCLDSKYLAIGTEQTSVIKFLENAFYVEELNDKNFYTEVVKKNISEIIKNTSGGEDSDGSKNLDFINYLDRNYKLIFEEEKDAEKFESFILLGDADDGGYYDIEANETYIYAYDSELNEILVSEWFPSDTVHMCSKDYGESKAIVAIKAQNYKFKDFFDDVISNELSNINKTITSKETSIAFHNFIIERLRQLTDAQKEVMKGAKVYLYGNDNACDRSDGHKILSKSARELAALGLVEFSDLDIIDPDYHIEANEDYWKNRLGNEQFTITDFVKWLSENSDSFYNTIEDKDSNINFWRWVKNCKLADKTLEELPVLPILINSDEYVDSDDTIYLSDDYIEEGGLETIVKHYHPDALFIDAEYMEEGDSKDSWKDFWVKIGVRFEMVDILIDTIDNRLDETEDEKLPATLVKYRTKLEEHYEGNFINNLKELRVKANDGEFYPLSEILYVDCEKDEPFPFIKLPKQATFATADERKLILEIIDEIDGSKIDRLTDWQETKINRYLDIQDDESDDYLLRSIHYQFVDELAKMYEADRDSLRAFEHIKDVLFLDQANNFSSAEELTEGSTYTPFCDFQKFNLNYTYLSDNYKNYCENDVRKMMSRVFKVHCDFKTKQDIKNLENREFAIYFWNQYLTKKDADISGVKKLIEDKEFDSVACVPTQNCMKKPTEIYALSISSFVIKHVVDWENKLPLQSLPDIIYSREENRSLFGLLLNKPSNLRLSFTDALYALFSISGQDRRSQLLSWMIETYDEKFDINIDEYRAEESACWKNAKNEDIHISKLYALAYGDRMLEQYFGNLPQIINKEYLPADPISFKSACDILKITTINTEDLIIDPINKTLRNDIYKQRMMIYALVLAGYEDANDWRPRYDAYCERIEEMNFWCCTAISLRYNNDEDICQKLKRFYHEKGNPDFYFVKSLDEKRVFKPFVESYIEYLQIEADKDFVETVMDSRESALDIAQDNNDLMLDEAFKDALDELIPGIKRELNGNEAIETDYEFHEDKRPTFSATDQPEEEFDEPSDAQNDNEDFENNEESHKTDGSPNDYELISKEKINIDDTDSLEALQQDIDNLDEDDFLNATMERIMIDGVEEEVVCEHYRCGTWVRGYNRSDGTYVHGHWRSGCIVDEHTRAADSTTHDNNAPVPSEESDFVPKYTDEDDIVDNYDEPYYPDNHDSLLSSYKPKGHKSMDTSWKDKEVQQAELQTREAEEDELDKIRSFISSAKSDKEIADEHYLVRYRLYNALVSKYDLVLNVGIEEFINSRENNIATNNGYIYARSAKGGILYLSAFLWNKLQNHEGRICIYYGNMADEFELIDTVDNLIKFVGRDNIIIQISGEDKKATISSVFNGSISSTNTHVLIRIKSNERFNSLFTTTFSNDDNNDMSI